MRHLFVVALVLAASPVAAQTPAAAPVAAPTIYTTTGTTIGTLLDDPAAKAILDKRVPGLSTNPQIDQARGMSLKDIQVYAAQQLTDDVLKAIDADLAGLAGK